ncbi:hypothetical protein K504DRAFT_500655 [Pleomassaria siparia CBS 279.74]|uniref:Uncharacterized protein n=1 Tax=Pleomassaria siparia CBS 279.74 TaxID=1314801 RepID=A0A6G1KD59_9PLEO|nr:hypothetical protein K504DRAFT_500655 [Pleomassaria siparia CBS 279.74]
MGARKIRTSTLHGRADWGIRTRLGRGEAAAAPGILQADILAGVAAITQQVYQAKQTIHTQFKKCNPLNMVFRKEWSTFAAADKKSYIASVKCLAQLPTKTPLFKVTGNFLGWVASLLHLGLRTDPPQRMWLQGIPTLLYKWPKWAYNPMASPALDGSDTSLSGNGVLGCTTQKSYGIPTNDAPLINIPHDQADR